MSRGICQRQSCLTLSPSLSLSPSNVLVSHSEPVSCRTWGNPSTANLFPIHSSVPPDTLYLSNFLDSWPFSQNITTPLLVLFLTFIFPNPCFSDKPFPILWPHNAHQADTLHLAQIARKLRALRFVSSCAQRGDRHTTRRIRSEPAFPSSLLLLLTPGRRGCHHPPGPLPPVYNGGVVRSRL